MPGRSEAGRVFGDDGDDEPEPDGRQFDAVTRFEEPDDPDLGPPVPEAPNAEDAPTGVRVRFWALAVVFNLAVLGVGVGLVLIVFDGNLEFGGQLLVAGLLLFGYGLYRYRNAKREIEAILEEKG